MACLTETSATFKRNKYSEPKQLRQFQLMPRISKTMGEAMWQALLQTTLIMAKDVPLFDQPLLLVSVVLSCITLAQRAAQLTFHAIRSAYASYDSESCNLLGVWTVRHPYLGVAPAHHSD
eukprot:4110182-Amphidinium_carterae.1